MYFQYKSSGVFRNKSEKSETFLTKKFNDFQYEQIFKLNFHSEK